MFSDDGKIMDIYRTACQILYVLHVNICKQNLLTCHACKITCIYMQKEQACKAGSGPGLAESLPEGVAEDRHELARALGRVHRRGRGARRRRRFAACPA